MSAKSKSTLPETPNSKVSVATPRVSSKTSRGSAKTNADSSATLQNVRSSVDQSPKSITSKPTIDKRSPTLSTPPDKKPTRILKPSELQAELNQAQEDLKKAKGKLAIVEKEKDKALNELKEVKKSAEEANMKLAEALMAQKRAEEDSEIEKFRAVELEQFGIEEAQKKEQEWLREIEDVRNQHAVDVSALLSVTEELQKVKQELAMTCDAKNQALNHAEDATKLAELNAGKVESLSAELVKVRSVLKKRVETEANEKNMYVSEVEFEIESLRRELEKAKEFELKLAEKETALEQLHVDLEASKMAESYSRRLVQEYHERVVELESQTDQAKRMERSASESLEHAMKQLKGNNDSLHDAESEIRGLKEKVGLLEIIILRQKTDLEVSENQLTLAKAEASEMEKKVESLGTELEAVREEKARSLENEKLEAEKLQTLSEEKNKLINELENSRDEEEKTKKALESLASALHEVSSEAREAKEKLLSVQVEQENYEKQIEDLGFVHKTTKEKYESMLDESKQEIRTLTHTVEQSKRECEILKAEWQHKEFQLMDSLKKSEQEKPVMENEINRLANSIKLAEEEARASKEGEDHWRNSFKEAEAEVIYLKEVLGEVKAESMNLKEGLMDKENELQNILQENEELRRKEAACNEKIEELNKLLEEALLEGKKHAEEENGELSESEKDYDMLPKVVEFSEQNGTGDVKLTNEPISQEKDLHIKENLVENKDEFLQKDYETSQKVEEDVRVEDNDDSAEIDLKMWESCKIEEKDFTPERDQEQESMDDDMESKTEIPSAEYIDNGVSPPSKENGSGQKKKKPLLVKFSSLLKKKKSPANHK